MRWKIFYSSSTYSDADGPPELAPKRDVQAVLVEDSVSGRRIERSNNYYVWTPERGGWRGVDKFGLFDYLIEPGARVVLFGRTLSDDEYEDILVRSGQDDYLPPKSAKLRSERPV
jgi:hypothetical protein